MTDIDLDTQRSVLALFLLGEPCQTIAAVKTVLHDIEPDRIDRALVALFAAGILEHEGSTMRLQPCVVRLAELGVLGEHDHPESTILNASESGLVADVLDEVLAAPDEQLQVAQTPLQARLEVIRDRLRMRNLDDATGSRC